MASSQQEAKGHVLVGPSVATTSLGDLEYSVHRVPRTHRDDIKSVFPKADCEALRIVPTCQRAREDLVKVGEEVMMGNAGPRREVAQTPPPTLPLSPPPLSLLPPSISRPSDRPGD